MAHHSVTFFLMLAVGQVWSHSEGAPETACVDMIPQHEVEAQTSSSPYLIKINKQKIKEGETVEVTLEGKSAKDTIKGFMVQARLDDTPVGSFDVSGASEYAQVLNCGSGKGNSATHIKHDGVADPQKIVLKWKPTALTEGSDKYTVKFRATIALDGHTFWINLLSEPVEVTK